jgi:hypothetical protein
MRGVDALLFAYGATSAGKTFTVQGSPDEPGLIPRMLRILLSTPVPKGTERGFLGSCVEVYNERLIDLFGETNKTLRIGKDEMGFTTVKGLNEIEIQTESDVTKMLKDIETARRQCSTRLNAVSSRSHCIVMLKLVTIPLDSRTSKRTTDLSQIRCTRLSVVDLAGSERVSPSDPRGQTVTEACNINKSMLVLGRCIREIRKANRGGSVQVPYRESKLTEMFRDFFEPSGGRTTMTAIIVNISPSLAQFDDTLFSLQFAAEAVECNVRTGDPSDDDFEPQSIDLDDGEDSDTRMLAETEARIRREIHEEMNERLRKIQSDYQLQVEQIRSQSAQPYTSKLQQALAQRMQKDVRSRELEECVRERDRHRIKATELETQIQLVRQELNDAQLKFDHATQKNSSLEGNIAAMIAATKKLHERHVQLQADLQTKTAEMETFWQQRVVSLEGELSKVKSKM